MGKYLDKEGVKRVWKAVTESINNNSTELQESIDKKQPKFEVGTGLELKEGVLNCTVDPEWYGTQDEYDELGTYDENTKYYILED